MDMSTTGLETFDKTLRETNHWLRIVMDELHMESSKHAFAALRAALLALRDRIGPAAALQLGAQLPMLLRGAYYENWRLAGTPIEERDVDGFIADVAGNLPAALRIDPEEAVRASFVVLTESLAPNESAKIARLLPPDIRSLLPGA